MSFVLRRGAALAAVIALLLSSSTSSAQQTPADPNAAPADPNAAPADPNAAPADPNAAPADPAPAPEPAPAPAPAPPPPPPAAAAHDQHVASDVPAPDADATAFAINAGFIANYGNARSVAGNAGARLSLTRGFNLFVTDFNVTVGFADSIDPMTMAFRNQLAPNSQVVAASARYDRFFDSDNSLYGRFAFKHDYFLNLAYRFQGQLGYGRTILREENHRFWGEIGFDFTYDRYREVVAPTSNDRDQYSARLFLGYDNHINENFTFLTGLEGLLDFKSFTLPTSPLNLRVNWNNELNAKIDTSLALNVKFTLAWMTLPPTTQQTNVDTVTTISLVYTLM